MYDKVHSESPTVDLLIKSKFFLLQFRNLPACEDRDISREFTNFSHHDKFEKKKNRQLVFGRSVNLTFKILKLSSEQIDAACMSERKR